MNGYIGIFLPIGSVTKLKDHLPPEHSELQYHHVTLKFNPSEAEVESIKAKLGNKVDITITGVASDDKCQAAVVKLSDSDLEKKFGHGKVLHITLSHTANTKPVYSNTLLQHGFSHTPTFTISGNLGFFYNGMVRYVL